MGKNKAQKTVELLKMGPESVRVKLLDALAPELKQGLSAHYPMLEVIDGKIHDYSVNANHATIEGPVISGNGLGKHSFFDMIDDRYLVSPNTGKNNIFAGGGTVSIWIEPNGNVVNGSRAVTQRVGAGWEINLNDTVDTDVNIEFFEERTGGQGKWNTAADYPIDTLYHLVITYDSDTAGNNATFYLNKEKLTVGSGLTGSSTGTPLDDSGRSMEIGNLLAFARPYGGKQKYLRLYKNRILTESEVIKLYNMEKPEFAIS